MIKNIYISGYRSFEMNIFNNNDPKLFIIKQHIKKELKAKMEMGLEWVITSGQLGIELWGAEAVFELQEEGYDLKLGVLLPFKNYGEKWKEQNSQLLKKVTTKADFFEYSSKKDYYTPKQLQGNQAFILKNTDGCLLVYDPEYEGKPKFLHNAIIRLQEYRKYELTMVSFDQLEETAREEAEKEQLKNDFY